MHALAHQAWYPTWIKAVCVFGPAQLVNQLFVPFQFRLLLLQSVGLGESRETQLTPGWNCYLSWYNNVTNKRLAATGATLERLQQQGADPQQLAQAQASLEAAEEAREKVVEEGSENGVARRMSWA